MSSGKLKISPQAPKVSIVGIWAPNGTKNASKKYRGYKKTRKTKNMKSCVSCTPNTS